MLQLRVCFAGAVLASMLAIACSSGGDIASDRSSPSSSSSSPLSCSLSAGENICGRTFDLPDDERANAVAFMQLASLFAGEARDLLDRTFAACDAIGVEIDVHGVGLPEDPPLKKKQSGCAAVGRAFAALSPSLVVERGSAVCSAVVLPTCATTAAVELEPYEQCTPPSFSVSVSSSAQGDLVRANAVAASLARHLPELGGLQASLEAMSRLSAGIVAGMAPLSSSSDHRTAACMSAAAAMVSAAIGEVQAAATANTLVFAPAVGP